MDVNGTRYHLLLGADDWGRCTDETGATLGDRWAAGDHDVPVSWDAGRADLSLTALTPLAPELPPSRRHALRERRGAGRDRFGSWYRIDDRSRGIEVHSIGSDATSAFWPAPSPQAARRPAPGPGAFGPQTPVAPAAEALRGLAVTDDLFLVAGAPDDDALLVFDLQGGGAPSRIVWPADVGLASFDITARPGGGVVVLDRDAPAVWVLDRHLRVQPWSAGPSAPAPGGGFGPEGGAPSAPAPGRSQALAIDDDAALHPGGSPIAVEALAGGAVLVLEAEPATVTLHRPGAAPASVALNGPDGWPALAAHDFAYVSAAGDGTLPGTLFVVTDDGQQAFSYTLSQDGGGALLADLLPDLLPLRSFGGRALVAAGGTVFYDFADRFLPLQVQPRRRHVDAATVTTFALDGREPGCVWHRIMLDACVPPGTALTVESRAAESPAELEAATWRTEPTPLPRRTGSELPFAGDAEPYETHELLVQHAVGRWAQLRIGLHGDVRSTPRIRALRAWYPRFSYLERYLPAVFREEPESASFLERYLANVEGELTAIEDQIAAAQVLLDPRTAPAGALDWLASFFDVALDPAWDETRRRIFLRHAVELFAARGTIRGLELALRLALDPCDDDPFTDSDASGGVMRIVEGYRRRRTPGVVLGDPTTAAGPALVPLRDRWSADQGGAVLTARWRSAIADDAADFPLSEPGDANDAAIWRRFCDRVLGVRPSASSGDVARWRAFLQRRYANAAAMAAAYAAVGAPDPGDPQAAELPSALPPDGAPLQDWWAFQSIVLPTAAAAHRFTVLLPLRDRGARDTTADLASRIVDLQKPAHTTFDVRFFWAAFRVGEARLGHDTLIESGSRAPELLAPAVLGAEALGTTYLGGAVATDAVRRDPTGPPETP